jgi:hypothetical protein
VHSFLPAVRFARITDPTRHRVFLFAGSAV